MLGVYFSALTFRLKALFLYAYPPLQFASRVLESQANAALHKKQTRNALVDSSAPPIDFTLRRLYVWVEEPIRNMRLLAMLTDSAQGIRLHYAD